jgi:cell division protein FtsL
MSVATPVLERKVSATENGAPQTTSYRSVSMSSEELHNSRIKDNYARLINPDYKIEDVFTPPEYIEKALNPAPAQIEAQPVSGVQQKVSEQPYFVENARADADIFRADSAINRRQIDISNVATETNVAVEEDESEDLRPTNTTIQYKTRIEEEEKVVQRPTTQKKQSVLGKKEKIIIATFVSIVIALFALVIINSAIIANLNTDLTNLQEGLNTVRGALASVNGEISQIISPESIAEFAETHNLILK